ncbi:hypothetical protein [Streptococcus cuniculi]|uniref:Uncharacterized protein n=1 Tax=Streptococcus cuniculi TaxID=1432788 RepID=A0A4Y9JDH0_9STRE|nr:hypothetical protein [Streptococcus cuniculi]MBF0777416.1 hypothetical protein [Streptococcus cuniculi]TFU99012.1 hypothetical protein E4T82_01520 [Streptococcus cuniculi]
MKVYNHSSTEFVCDFIGSINKLSYETLTQLQGASNFFFPTLQLVEKTAQSRLSFLICSILAFSFLGLG